jgi:hypothetical protein
MIRRRSKAQVRWYDLFKLAGLLLPLAIAAFLMWPAPIPGPSAEVSPTPANTPR